MRAAIMRIIAGKYRSRKVHSTPGSAVRPTSDRLRETLFSVIAAARAMEGTRWLDLFAGTGAVGMEALSRGAGHVTFVESSKRQAALIRKNLAALKIEEGVELLAENTVRAIHGLEKCAAQRPLLFDVVFLDPPYIMQEQYSLTLRALAGSHILAPDSLVIADHEKRFDPGEEFGRLQRFRTLKQGDSALSFYRPSAV